MQRTRNAVVVSVLLAAAAPLGADQLAWITRAQAEAAVAKLPGGSIVVAYCSMCDERPEVWSVDRASVVPTSDGEHYQVRIEGRLLARSRGVVKKGAYSEPVDYESLPPRRVRKDVDLAYLYAHQSGDQYRVLGEVLGLPCEVQVHVVAVPSAAATARAVVRGSAAATLHIWASGGRDSEDSADDVRKHILDKMADAFTIVEDADEAEVQLTIRGRTVTKGQGTDLNGQPALKDFYRIEGRVKLLDDSEPLAASQEFNTIAPWHDAAKAFASELDSFVQQRLHRILQARLAFPALGGTVEEMDDTWRQRLGKKKAKGGAFVSVTPGGPAATAGLQPGDVVVEIDGKKTKHAWDVARIVWDRGPGTPLRLKVKREDAERTLTLTPGEP